MTRQSIDSSSNDTGPFFAVFRVSERKKQKNEKTFSKPLTSERF